MNRWLEQTNYPSNSSKPPSLDRWKIVERRRWLKIQTIFLVEVTRIIPITAKTVTLLATPTKKPDFPSHLCLSHLHTVQPLSSSFFSSPPLSLFFFSVSSTRFRDSESCSNSYPSTEGLYEAPRSGWPQLLSKGRNQAKTRGHVEGKGPP